MDIINVPLGFIINALYSFTHNYAVTLLLFALAVQIILLPLSIKQQKGQVKMALTKPKELAIRKKYAGRNDKATATKMQSEIMEMQRSEGYSAMSGCLPLLIQLPILLSLYNIVRNPLTYILQIPKDSLSEIKNVIYNLYQQFSAGGIEWVADYANMFKGITDTSTKNIQEVNIVKILDHPEFFDAVKSLLPENFNNINLDFFGLNLADAPSMHGISLFLIIPILNFATAFGQARISRIFNRAAMQTGNASNDSGMKIMEYTMPLLTVYTAWILSSALGLYWIFRGIIMILQTIIFAKLYPMPKFTDEDYKLAEAQFAAPASKKKPKKDRSISTSYDDERAARNNPSTVPTGNKYISPNLAKGINPVVKNKYAKTGKKYKAKRK